MILRNALTNTETEKTNELILTDPTGWRHPDIIGSSKNSAMKIATVSACVEIRSDSIGKLPFFIMDRKSKKRDYDHYMAKLLTVRPNEAMSPFVFKKLIESWRLIHGNAYIYISRSKIDGAPVELIPIQPKSVRPEFVNDRLVYFVADQKTGKGYRIEAYNMIHLKGFTDDGVVGQSVLARAAETIYSARQQQQYEGKFYNQNARPSGVVQVQSDLGKTSKDKFREEWQKVYGGADNAFKVAVLDNGMEYKPISMSQKDAQFVESKDITVADIARFFLVPLYKLQAGKQTYQSNEQNAIEYVVTSLSPTVTQYEEEFTYKSLFPKEINKGKEIRMNMNAELRGDTDSRSTWYSRMRNLGAYSPNDIRGYEDLPDVEGGDLRIAPLNSIPLEQMDVYFDYLMEKGGTANQGGVPQGG
ncbi:MAG: phage portal protein [Bacillota bacterium]|nr:phage portal protein [Bacillota bacterium]